MDNFEQYRSFYMSVWANCLSQGYSSADAREYAQLEWDSFINKGE